MSHKEFERNSEGAHETPWIEEPLQARKGRGAVTHIQGRYESEKRESIDDGWQAESIAPAEEGMPPRIQTVVTHEQAKSILTRNNSPDMPFNVSLNPYRG